MLVRDRSSGMGSAGSVLRSVGGALKSEALKTGRAAVQGVSTSIGDRLRNWVGPATPGGGGAPSAASYLPWALGLVAVLGLGYVVVSRRAP
jgi:hypothetical protein